jgi:hypothetical protein
MLPASDLVLCSTLSKYLDFERAVSICTNHIAISIKEASNRLKWNEKLDIGFLHSPPSTAFQLAHTAYRDFLPFSYARPKQKC